MGKGVIIAINKTDCLNAHQQSEVKKDVAYALKHLPYVPIMNISATTGKSSKKLIQLALQIAKQFDETYGTAQLTRILEKLVKRTQPPTRLGRPINLRMAHMSRTIPLEITVRGKRTSYLPQSYLRYLSNGFIEKLNLVGRSIKLHMKSDDNPFIDQ